jgi:hypothetical protein
VRRWLSELAQVTKEGYSIINMPYGQLRVCFYYNRFYAFARYKVTWVVSGDGKDLGMMKQLNCSTFYESYTNSEIKESIGSRLVS